LLTCVIDKCDAWTEFLNGVTAPQINILISDILCNEYKKVYVIQSGNNGSIKIKEYGIINHEKNK